MRKCLFSLVILLFATVLASNVWAASKAANKGRVDQLRVMTRNLYIGADILGVNEPRPCGALQAVHELFEEIIASNPPERMEAIADEIMQKQPHVVALQEVYRISTQFPSDSYVCDFSTGQCGFGNYQVNFDDSKISITFIPNANQVVFDYLKLLLKALDARGLQYNVVEDAVAYESDFEFPSWNLDPGLGCTPASGAPPLPTDIRAEDRDVILVRSDVVADSGSRAQYSTLLPFTISTGEDTPDVKIISVRGYGATDITYEGQTYRFVNTHLEVDDQSSEYSPINQIQAAQAQQLIGTLASETLPLVVAGDFNSSPDPSDVTQSYELMVDAGYTDIWTQFGGRPDDTCCQAADLSNFKSELSKRVDLILARPSKDTEFLPSPVWLTGDRQGDKTASGLWPSDHAGVATMLKFKQ
jgi:endonuclease/exonuclease/phosphatase family metal-dependent hydrolase